MKLQDLSREANVDKVVMQHYKSKNVFEPKCICRVNQLKQVRVFFPFGIDSLNSRLCCRNQKDEYISQNGHVRGLLVSTTSDAREESLVEEARKAEDYGGTLITKQLTLWKLI